MGKALSIFVILGLCGSARADDAVAGAKTVLAAQLTGDAATFGKTFADDGLLLIDGHAVVGPDAAADAFRGTETITSQEAVIVSRKPGHVTIGAIGDDAAWLTAEVVVTGGLDESVSKWTVEVTELVVRDGDGWRVKAAQIAEPIADRAVGTVEDGITTDPIPDAKSDAAHEASLSVAALAAALGTGKSISIVGSAPKERATGAAKVKKLLKKWAKLSFAVNGGVRWVDGGEWAYAAARVDLAAKGKTIPYRVLAIFQGGKLVAAHFGYGGTQ